MGAVDFLKKNPSVWRMGLILLLGVCLLLLASGSGKSEQNAEGAQDDLAAYGEGLEQRLSSLCERVVGVGDTVVMVTFECGAQVQYRGSTEVGTLPPRVQGVTVLCEGGENAAVREALSDMLCALLGIGASRVSVLPLA